MNTKWVDIPKYWLVIFVIGILIGLLIIGWEVFLGPLSNRADYNNFNNSPQHLNAVAQLFGRDCQQLAQTHDPQTIKALENDIYSNAETVDVNEVKMSDYTRACVMHAISDETGGSK